MNKRRVESYLPYALKALEGIGIAKNGEIPDSFRGQISSFGAAVAMGSFKSAVAFFSVKSDNKDSKVDRSKLIEAIWCVLVDAGEETAPDKNASAADICKVIIREEDAPRIKMMQEKFLDVSIALKLAMNAFTLTGGTANGKPEPSV